MNKIGLGLDHNNICKDYNTVYLDRDNNDPETSACMRKVLAWMNEFITELQSEFNYNIYRLNHQPKLKLKDLVQKRFFFYSLEKGVTLQNFILQKEDKLYRNLSEWAEQGEDSLLIQNDEEGEGVYFYMVENSELHQWFKERLKDYSLYDVPFQEKY